MSDELVSLLGTTCNQLECLSHKISQSIIVLETSHTATVTTLPLGGEDLEDAAVLLELVASELTSYSGSSCDVGPLLQTAPQLDTLTISIEPGDHLCLPYNSYDMLSVAAFHLVKLGLDHGAFVLIFVGRKVAELLLHALNSRGIDTTALMEAGRFSVMDRSGYKQYLSPERRSERLFQMCQNILSQGFPSLYAFADLPKSQGKHPTNPPQQWQENIVKYEHIVTDLVIKRLPVAAICCYNENKMDASFSSSARSVHPLVMQGTPANVEIAVGVC
ncbi:hypothetical protein Pelo_16017 [Pelomyxa schiedti]|nr:hypothetical protein Pelo_16017 [Pelomyxa schiedti]